MAASEENSALFPIVLLSIMALTLVPYTILKLFRLASKKTKSIHCECSVCSSSGKYQISFFKRISNSSTCSNLTMVLLWVIMGVLVYYVKHISREIQVFEPFHILGLDPGASDAQVKKAYRRLSIQYHPDKNPDPEAHKYFIEYISKAYQALTDPISRENFEKYGHPDGRQGFQMGIALPTFLLNFDGSTSGMLLLWIVGFGILLPLVAAAVYLSRSSKYTGNYVRRETRSTYFELMKPSLAPSKVMGIFIKAAEYKDIPVRKSDDELLQKLFSIVKTELNLDLKNIKMAQAKFWKQHPSLVKTELLMQAHLTRQTAALSPDLQHVCKFLLQLAPRLLEEFIKMATIPRTTHGHGLLMPALGAVELSQCIVQAVPRSARKKTGGSAEGIAPFLQLPHFSDVTSKNILNKVRTFQELRDLTIQERAVLLTELASLSASEVQDVENVLGLMPCAEVEITCETEGEETIQEGDIITVLSWVKIKRPNGLIAALPHCPYYPFDKDENFWFLLAEPDSNNVWVSQKVSFTDESAVATAANVIEEKMEASGANPEETSKAVKEAVEKVRNGYRLVTGKCLAPPEGTYNLICYFFCDSWIGCDEKRSLLVKVMKGNEAGSRGHRSDANEPALDDEVDEEDESDEEETDDNKSEYSEDEVEN